MRQATADREPNRGSGLPVLAMGVMLALGAVPVLTMAWPRSAHEMARGSGTRSAPDVVAERSILFDDNADGSATILDATDGSVLATMKTGDGGFVRTMLRLLAGERRRHDAAGDAPFRVTHWNTGSVTIHDPAVGRTIELKAFGATNAEAFAQLLETRRTSP